MSGKFDFELYQKEGGNAKNAVLLFHGLTGNPFEMKKYGFFLQQLGFDVFCHAFPGHGKNMDEIYDVSYQDWINFAQQKYNELRPKYENFFVSGLCMGASVAIYLAEHNRDISGVISISTTLYLDGFSMPKFKFLMPLALNTIYKYYYTFPEDSSLGIKNEETRKKLAKIMSKTSIGMDNYPLCCVQELLELSKIVRKNLHNVTSPILLIHSTLDNLTTPKSAKTVMDGVASKVKRYTELHDSYHMVLYDNEKEFVFHSIKNFLCDILNLEKEEEEFLI